MKTENITLFYKQEKSDKVYKVSLEESEDKYLVNFAYGRRGATLKTGTKTQSAVEYEKQKRFMTSWYSQSLQRAMYLMKMQRLRLTWWIQSREKQECIVSFLIR